VSRILADVTLPDKRSLQVPEGLEGERVDAAIARLFGVSRTKAAELIGEGAVLVDGVAPLKSERIHNGALLEVELPARATPHALPAPSPVTGLEVIFDDDDIVVVAKPVGVAAHSSPGWEGPTVVGGLLAAGYAVATSGAEERQGIVHRLDVGTSGVMVVAKSEVAYRVLKAAFKSRDVDKRYHALVQGHPDPSRGTVDAPIGRHPRDDWRWAVTASGKPSVTHYETLEAFPGASLLMVRLETGRTHQIRVHMSALRHPCIGDLTYGADPVLAETLEMTHQWLHAESLGFQHPATGEPLSFRAPYPDDLRRSLESLRTGVGSPRNSS
jgi:23S rRNA pseudouridine1911/1915/1917 synthase